MNLARVWTDLSNQAWPTGVSDVILTYVSMEPVADVQKLVIQGQDDVSYTTYTVTSVYPLHFVSFYVKKHRTNKWA